jgi:hypothetical protein
LIPPPLHLGECVASACAPIPGLQEAALALLPEGLLLGGVGEGRGFDREPLVRCAARALCGSAVTSVLSTRLTTFVEHLLVGRDKLIVILRGVRYPRLALAISCTKDTNPAFVMSSSRSALRSLETTLELAAWEV